MDEEKLPKTSVKDMTPAVCEQINVSMFLDTVQYNQGFRAARLLAASRGMIPKEYQGNEANCMLALNMAQTLGLTVAAFFQWTYIVHGKLGLESKAIVTIANQSGRFKRGIEFEEIKTREDGDAWGFRAFAEDTEYGVIIEEIVTVGDVKSAGWWQKKDSWWPKLTRMMLKYRAASFLIKLNRPELLGGMGIYEEMRDEGLSVPAVPDKNITGEAEEVPENTKTKTPPRRTKKNVEEPKQEPTEEAKEEAGDHGQPVLHEQVAQLKQAFDNPEYAAAFDELYAGGKYTLVNVTKVIGSNNPTTAGFINDAIDKIIKCRS